MKLHLNGTLIDSQSATLADLLIERGFGESKVATAVNEAFVPATARSKNRLNDGDRIEILAPMQGG